MGPLGPTARRCAAALSIVAAGARAAAPDWDQREALLHEVAQITLDEFASSSLHTAGLFGSAVDMDATSGIAVVGAPTAHSSRGASWSSLYSQIVWSQGSPGLGTAFAFERQPDGSWTQTFEFVPELAEDTDCYPFPRPDPTPEGCQPNFGKAVAVDGTRILIGAGGGQLTQGAAYVFERQASGTWLQTAVLRSLANSEQEDGLDDWQGRSFGHSVALDGDTALVGEPRSAQIQYYSSGSSAKNWIGHVYAFERQADGTWLRKDRFSDQWGIDATTGRVSAGLGLDALDGDGLFGVSVALDGDRAIIGAGNGAAGNHHQGVVDGWFGCPYFRPPPEFNSCQNKGQAYIFERQGDGTWLQTFPRVGMSPRLWRPDGNKQGDQFGSAVDIQGDRAVVGAYLADGGQGQELVDAGAVYIFQRQLDQQANPPAATWIKTATLRATNAAPGDQFGVSVSLQGDSVLVGANTAESSTGAAGAGACVGADTAESSTGGGVAYLFEFDGNTWTQTHIFEARSSTAGDSFGLSVALDAGLVLIGADGTEGSTSALSVDNAGSAFVFSPCDGHDYSRTSHLRFCCDDFSEETSVKDGSCTSCSGRLRTECTSAECSDGYTPWRLTSGVCCNSFATVESVVDDSCISCSDSTPSGCLAATCKIGYHSFGEGECCRAIVEERHDGSCRCTVGYYFDQTQGQCAQCDPGMTSADDRLSCIPCGATEYTPAVGVCVECAEGKVPTASGGGCETCPPGQTSRNGTCVCAANHYNSSFGHIFCFEQDYFVDAILNDEYTTARVQHESGLGCLECPRCVSCNAGTAPVLLPGFSLSPHGLEIWRNGLDLPAPGLSPRSAFSCSLNGEVCNPNVTSSNVDADSHESHGRRLATSMTADLNRQCAEGHTGSLCGECAPDWTGSFGERCKPCAASDWRVPAGGLLILLSFTGCVYGRLKTKAEEMQGRLDGMRAKYALARKAVAHARKIRSEIQEAMDKVDEQEGTFQATLDTVKIVISNLQIIAQLPVTLKFSCPLCANIKQMMSILPAVNLDALQAFSVDCLTTVGLHKRFTCMLVGPAAAIAFVVLWGRTGRSKVQVLTAGEIDLVHNHDRSSKANQIILLIIFLVYPSVSTTIFSVFSCRTLDFQQSVHVYDASIDCNSADYKALFAAALVALVLVPIGVPVVFAYVLFKNRARLGNRPEDTIPFEVFSATARSILKDASLTDADLRCAYDLIDVDNSGEVSSAELWRSALQTVLSSATASKRKVAPGTEKLHGSDAAAGADARTIWVGNLDQGTDQEQVKAVFEALSGNEEHGDIVEDILIREKLAPEKNWSLVTFFQAEHAKLAALATFRGRRWLLEEKHLELPEISKDWKIEMVKPHMLSSNAAQLVHNVSQDHWHNTEELRGSEAAAAASFEHRGSNAVAKTKWWEGGPEEYRFLVRAYEPRYFWYELVHYGKKFVLSGVLVFAGPGSTAQLYVGLIVSFYFFGLLSRCTPYKNSKTDRTAMIAEANLFFTMLCLLMLKLNLTGEWLAREFYDTVLVGSNVVVALAPTAIAVVLGLHRLASEWADSASDPLSKGDRARILDCPQSLRSCGHVATVLSSTDDTITVRVRIPASSPRKDMSLVSCRDYLCCFPGKAEDLLQHELSREQLQLILGRKQFLRLCAAVCKQLVLCWRARGALDSATDAKEESGENSNDHKDFTTNDMGAMARDITFVADVETDDDLDDTILKEEALTVLRSVCEPALAQRGATWDHAENVIAKLSSLSELHQAIEDPEAFVARMWELLEPLVKEAALAKLQPYIEPHLEKHGVPWEHARQVLSMVTSITRLHKAVEDPDAFVSELQSASTPAAKAFAIAKLRPALEPLLAQHAPGVTWEQMVAVLETADTTEELSAALDNPVTFFEQLRLTV